MHDICGGQTHGEHSSGHPPRLMVLSALCILPGHSAQFVLQLGVGTLKLSIIIL